MLGDLINKKMTRNFPQPSCTDSRRAFSVDLTLPTCLIQQNVLRKPLNLSTYCTRAASVLWTRWTHVIRRHHSSLAVNVPLATVGKMMLFLRIGVPRHRSYDFFAKRSSVRLCLPLRDISPVLVPTPESVGLLTSRM